MTSPTDHTASVIREEDRRFLQMVSVSSLLHLVILVLMSLLKWSVPSSPLFPMSESITVDLVSIATLSNDGPVKKAPGLPRKATYVPQPESAPQEPDETLYEEKAPGQEDEKPEETPRPSRGVDSRSLNKLSSRVSSLLRKKAVSEIKGAPGAHNLEATSPNGARNGTGAGKDGGGASASLDPEWIRALKAQIETVWYVREELKSKELLVQLSVKVNSEGGIRDVDIERGSGNTSFDNAAIRAVKKAAPLKLPKNPELKRTVLTEGFTLGFDPKGLTR